MALVKPILFQVVGYQNCGKTTFILKLIQILKNNGLKTVTIKHHGHGGKPDVFQQKDSTRHLEAGAMASLVEGEGRMLLQAEDSTWTLEEQISFMNFFHPDIILIEGHKKEPYPKLLIIRDENDLSLITKVNNIKAIIVWKKDLTDIVWKKLKVPAFHIAEEKAVTEISKELIKLVCHFGEKN